MRLRSVISLALSVLAAPTALYLGQVTTLASGDSYSVAVLADSPAAYWRLDQLGTVVDQVGSSSGTTMGNVSLDANGALTSSTDPALTFDGATGYINLPPSAAVEPTAALTVEAWVQSSSLVNAASVIRLRCNSVPDCGYAIAVSSAADGNRPFFYVVDSAGTFHVLEGATSVVDGKWYHLVATKDATGLHLYVDGMQVGSLAYVGAVHYGVVTGFAIARDGDDPNFFFNGSIDEVAVYSSALSATQVAHHYAVAVTPPAPPPTSGSCPPAHSGSAATAGSQARDDDRSHADRDRGRCSKRRHTDSGADAGHPDQTAPNAGRDD